MKLFGGLQGRFIALMLLVLLLVMAGMVALWQRQLDVQGQATRAGELALRDMSDDNLRLRAEETVAQLAESLAEPLFQLDLDAIAALSDASLRQPDIRYVLVYGHGGEVVHGDSDGMSGFGNHMLDPLAAEAPAARNMQAQWAENTLDVSGPVLFDGRRVGGVRVGYDLSRLRTGQARSLADFGYALEQLGHQQLLLIVLVGGGLVALGALLVWLLHSVLIAPIRQLASAARSIEYGDYQAAVPQSSRADEIGELIRGFARMRDSIARHDRDIRRAAHTDVLTGLGNRPAFRETLDENLLQMGGASGQLALLFVDIDDFKRINDTLGHEAGDEVLLQFASRIRAVVEQDGNEGVTIARFGGDQFVILLLADLQQEESIRDRASRVADALLADMARAVTAHGRPIFLGISIGITLFPDDAADSAALMKNGDIAVYQAKVAGKQCYRFYSRAMDQAVERRVRMETELRDAWARGELSLAYQPVYRLADGQMVGAEALLRWHHPEQGMIPPSVFIEVAEQSGLIESIGRQVLHQACEDTVRWQGEHAMARGMFVAVNVSPRQLTGGDLAMLVADCLRDSGLPASCLHLELTETAIIADEVHASSVLARLRSCGVKVWLDDFGTGFSGLSHLRRVPVDGVKIDRSFIAGVLRDPEDLALTAAIIAMAHSLGITVVAEGVETEGQYAILRERGCDLAQGFWLGHPVAAGEFAHLLA